MTAVPAPPLSIAKLAAILLSLAMVLSPHFLHLPGWISLLAAVTIGLRFYLGYRHRPLPPRWILISVALCSVAGVAVSYRTLYGRDVGVALLSVMATLKLLEMSTPRDFMAIVLLAFFLMVTNFFYSQSIPTALYMVGCLWVVTATMVGLQYRASPPRLYPVLRHAGTMMLQGVPIMIVLFLLFPRVPGPLWGLPQVNYSGRSGLSDSMAPGDVSRLSLSDGIAFRVLFDKPPENAAQFYWRGPVFWNFDGRTWRPGVQLTSGNADLAALAPPIRYTVTLEPHDQPWMFAIDIPGTIPAGARMSTDFQLLSRKPVRERLRYTVESIPEYRADASRSANRFQPALRLPAGYSPRTRQLAESWRAQSASEREIVEKALRMFREQPFSYTLEPPPLGLDPVDQFLFETRSGFCEHYASAFTFLMRAAGVPARVVTGYLGGELNPVDGYLVVRQSEAHAWSEIWLSGEGWVRVDPTAAVSPLRIERGLLAAVPATDALPLLSRTQIDWIRQARFALDAAANSWNQWVLAYTPERQVDLLSRLGFDRVSWEDMVIALMLILGAILTVLALVLLVRTPARRKDPVQQLYDNYCRAMAVRGITRKPSEGARDFAARIALEMPQGKAQAQHIGMLYQTLRYGSKQDYSVYRDRELLAEFKQAVQALP
ncbi:MAG: DUF3488 and DUF4129 domain-containing transglutaminase family protein [Burkholderiales bacterium]